MLFSPKAQIDALADQKCEAQLKQNKEFAIFKRKEKIWKIRSAGPPLADSAEMDLLSFFHLYGSHTNSFVPKHARLVETTSAHKNKKSVRNKYYIEYSRDGTSWFHYCTNKSHNGTLSSD